MTSIKTVGVVGAGTMGVGIAIVAARAGFVTRVYDTREDALARARRPRRRRGGRARRLSGGRGGGGRRIGRRGRRRGLGGHGGAGRRHYV